MMKAQTNPEQNCSAVIITADEIKRERTAAETPKASFGCRLKDWVRRAFSKAGPFEKEDPKRAHYRRLIEQASELLEEGKIDDAVQTAQQALSLGSSWPEAYRLIGLAQESMSRSLDAIRYYRAAIAIDPTFTQAYRDLDRITKSQ